MAATITRADCAESAALAAVCEWMDRQPQGARILHLAPDAVTRAALASVPAAEHCCTPSADGEGLRFVGESFDGAVCDARRLGSDPAVLLRRIAELLRPGATAVVRVAAAGEDAMRSHMRCAGFFVTRGAECGELRVLRAVRGEVTVAVAR